jgi:hypothetical protein
MDNCPTHVAPPDLLALKRLLSGTNGNSSAVSPGTQCKAVWAPVGSALPVADAGTPSHQQTEPLVQVTPKSGSTEVADSDQARLGDRAEADAGASSRSRQKRSLAQGGAATLQPAAPRQSRKGERMLTPCSQENFQTAKLRRARPGLCPRQGRAQNVPDYYAFTMDYAARATGQLPRRGALATADWRGSGRAFGLRHACGRGSLRGSSDDCGLAVVG